jgi:hypothetical protein
MLGMYTIEEFLTTFKSLSIGYSDINLSSLSQLDKHQIGYSKDPSGKSLVTGVEGDWKEEWRVIGWDGLGDPIFVDLKSENLEVFSAVHGQGVWEPYRISDSLGKFAQIFSKLRELAKDRENPVSLEKKPMSHEEANNFLDFVMRNNPDSDISFWEAVIAGCLE